VIELKRPVRAGEYAGSDRATEKYKSEI